MVCLPQMPSFLRNHLNKPKDKNAEESDIDQVNGSPVSTQLINQAKPGINLEGINFSTLEKLLAEIETQKNSQALRESICKMLKQTSVK